MNIFKSFTLRWWEAGIFKLALGSIGIFVGATWPEIFSPWRPVLLVVFVLSTIFTCRVWWKQ